MEAILQNITTTLRSIHPESYYQMNPQATISYPYITFDLSTEEIGRNQEGGILELDLFGNGSSPLSVVQLEEEIKDALKYRRDLTADLNITYKFQTSLTIPTLVPDVHRRNVTFYLKIDQRSKHYGTS